MSAKCWVLGAVIDNESAVVDPRESPSLHPWLTHPRANTLYTLRNNAAVDPSGDRSGYGSNR